jgi:hypothetical protein
LNDHIRGATCVGIENAVESLELRMNRMISFLPERRRPYFNELEKRFTAKGILLAGPRGSGKTTFLLSLAQKRNLFYISADDPIIYTVPFQQLAQYILVNYDGLIIDEVHYLKDGLCTLKASTTHFQIKRSG